MAGFDFKDRLVKDRRDSLLRSEFAAECSPTENPLIQSQVQQQMFLLDFSPCAHNLTEKYE